MASFFDWRVGTVPKLDLLSSPVRATRTPASNFRAAFGPVTAGAGGGVCLCGLNLTVESNVTSSFDPTLLVAGVSAIVIAAATAGAGIFAILFGIRKGKAGLKAAS